MRFDIENTVALITGGASGIGLCIAKELIKNGAKGVTLADISTEFGQKAIDELGSDKAFFVKTDVSDEESFEEAFRQTIKRFQNLDIVVNNAALYNDANWPKEIAVNFNGTVYGMLLALRKYFPKYKSGSETVLVNIASTAGLQHSYTSPIYGATKWASVSLVKTFGNDVHYNTLKTKVLALCPFATDTKMFDFDITGNFLGQEYEKAYKDVVQYIKKQKPESVAAAFIKIVKSAKSGSVWVSEFDKEPYEYIHPAREDFRPK